jgi:glycosyltransferase involved in cell wall biosynthesis
MKIAFVTNLDSSDVRAWSGTVLNMRRGLEQSGLDVEVIDKLRDPYGVFFKAKRVAKNVVLQKNYLRDREPSTLRSYARQIESELNRIKPNIIFSPGTIPIAYLRTEIPIIFWADATFDGMINFYPEFSNLCDETIRNGRRMEQAALSKCRLAIYSSEWAAESASDNYDVDSKKIKVVPYGANLSHTSTADEIRDAIASRGSAICKLLFVGVDWNRKGGDQALQLTAMLNQQGFDVELHVVGCEPPSPVPSFVKTYGYLSKDNREQKALLVRLYKMADFFVLPSKAECAAVVIAEANSFGLPVLTTNVGGMKTVVREGKNGLALAPSCFVSKGANYVREVLSSKAHYYQLCESSFKEYSMRLNWHSAVQSVRNLMALEKFTD